MTEEKVACRCPTDWCRLEPDNGAEYCPDLGSNEFCGQRKEPDPGEAQVTDQSQQINADLKVWAMASPAERAKAVLDWCEVNGVDTSTILAHPLAVAMAKQPYWMQEPGHYLAMVKSIAAFLAAR